MEVNVQVWVNRFDTLLKDWQWDIEVRSGSVPTMVLWRFSAVSGGGLIYDTDGVFGYDKVPMEANSIITFYGLSPAGKQMRCTNSVDPINAPQFYKIDPRILTGSVTSQRTAGQERTGTTGSVAITGGGSGGVRIPFLANAQVNSSVTGTVALPSDKRSSQDQTSVTSTTEDVASIGAKRFVNPPDSIEGMNNTRRSTRFG